MKTKHVFLTAGLALSLYAAQAQDITSGLQAHFRFDGDLLDATPNNNDLTGTGTISYTTVSGSDQALTFAGASNASSTAPFNNSTYTEEAISIWINTTTVTSNLQIVLQGANLGFGLFMQATTGRIIGFFDGSSAGAYVSSVTVNDGNWHHIVLQSDGSTTYMYIDGALDGSMAETLFVGNGGSNNRLFFGRSNQTTLAFTGMVNETRIYNRMLTDCDIDLLFARATPPVAYYPFDNSLADVTGNGFDFSVTTGSASYTTFAAGDPALVLNGSTRIRSNPIDNSGFTQEGAALWVRTSSTTAGIQFILQGSNMGFGLFMDGSTGRLLAFFDGSAAGACTSTVAINDGDWHHVILQNNGTTTQLFIDGSLDNTLSESLLVGSGGPTSQLFMGISNLGVSPFTGDVNEVYLYDRLITPCELKYLTDSSQTDSAASRLLLMAVNESTSAQTVSVYPNPTDGTFWVNLGANAGSTDLELVDMTGKVIRRERNYQSQTLRMNLDGMAPGIYFVRITSANTQQTLKLIKR